MLLHISYLLQPDKLTQHGTAQRMQVVLMSTVAGQQRSAEERHSKASTAQQDQRTHNDSNTRRNS